MINKPFFPVCLHFFGSIDVPFGKNTSTGTAQQRLFLVFKVVLSAVVVISEVLNLSTKGRCSRCCIAHLCLGLSRQRCRGFRNPKNMNGLERVHKVVL